MLKSIQNILIRKFGSVGQTISGSAPSYEGPLDLVPGAVVAMDQYAPSAAYLGQPFATIGGVVYTYDAVTGLNNGVAGTVSQYSGGPAVFSQATAGRRPVFTASVFGDVPAFEFASASEIYLTTPSVTLASGEYTIAMVIKGTTALGGMGITGINNQQDPDGHCFSVSFDSALTAISALATSDDFDTEYLEITSQNPPPNIGENENIIIVRFTDGQRSIRINGVAADVSVASDGSVQSISAALAVGVDDADPNFAFPNFFNGYIGNIYIWDSYISDVNTTALEALNATRYGITLP